MRWVATSARNGSGVCTDSRSAVSTRARSSGRAGRSRANSAGPGGRSGSPDPVMCPRYEARGTISKLAAVVTLTACPIVPMVTSAAFGRHGSARGRRAAPITLKTRSSDPGANANERRIPTVFERFTDRARRVVVLAQEEARLLNHNYIGTEHILLGLIHEGEGVAAKAL